MFGHGSRRRQLGSWCISAGHSRRTGASLQLQLNEAPGARAAEGTWEVPSTGHVTPPLLLKDQHRHSMPACSTVHPKGALPAGLCQQRQLHTQGSELWC
jgi:hypothetical protein